MNQLEIKKHKLFYMLFLSVIIFVPFLFYTYVIYRSPNLDNYFNLLSTVPDKEALHYIFNLRNLPTISNLIVTCWLGFSFYLIGIFLIISLFFQGRNKLIFKISAKTVNSFRKRIFIIVSLAIFFLVAGSILYGVSEYHFAWFNKWVTELVKHNPEPNSVVSSVVNAIIPSEYNSDKNYIISGILNIIANPSGGYGVVYGWIDLNSISVLVSVQILLLIYFIIRLAFGMNYNSTSFFTKVINRAPNGKSRIFEINNLKNKFNSMLENNQENICLAIILITIIAFVPQIIFIIFLKTSSGFNLNFIDYTYILPSLFPDPQYFMDHFHFLNLNQVIGYYNAFHNISSSYGFVEKLPIFTIFVSTAFWLVYVYIYTQKTDLSHKGFKILYISFWIVQLVSICIIFSSQFQLSIANKFWSSPENRDYTVNFFGVETLRNRNIRSNELYSSTFLSLMVVCVSGLIIYKNIQKIVRKKIILNNNLNNK